LLCFYYDKNQLNRAVFSHKACIPIVYETDEFSKESV